MQKFAFFVQNEYQNELPKIGQRSTKDIKWVARRTLRRVRDSVVMEGFGESISSVLDSQNGIKVMTLPSIGFLCHYYIN